MKHAATALLIVGLIGSPASAYQLRRDSNGQSVSWAGHADFILDSNAAALLKEPNTLRAVQRAINTYAAAVPEITLSVKEGPTSGVGYDPRPGAQNESAIVVLEDWTYEPDALAITVVTVDTKTHNIVDADIALNGQLGHFKDLSNNPDANSNDDDIQNTVTHELGHALGLSHSPDQPHAVMFPSASHGEVTKRTLSQDDQSGLAALYSSASSQPRGCSATGGSLSLWMLMIPLFALITRHRRAARAALVAAAFVSPAAWSSENARRPAQASQAHVVATAEVVKAHTHQVNGSEIWTTEVEAKVRNCIKGNCPDTVVIKVPGGRQGDLEQWVDGRGPLEAGSQLGVTVTQEVKPGGGTHGAKFELFHLGQARDFAAFAQGVRAAGLSFVQSTKASEPKP